MTQQAITLYALNDFFVKAKLTTGNPATGAVTALIAGTVTAFLATSAGPTAVAADPALSMSPVHIGLGVWLIFWDASVLTPTLLDLYFAATPPYLIVQQPGGIRTANPLVYATTRPALVG